MSTAISIAAGQAGKVLRLPTGYDLSSTTARIVRIRRETDAPTTFAGVPFDPAVPTDMLWTIPAGAFATPGTYAVEVEVQAAGGVVLKPDQPMTIEVFGLGEPDA